MKNNVPVKLSKWDDQKIANFQREFLQWYAKERRLLPWRETKNPYYIWVSEIMLQQTQVATVIPYYYRFIEWFPTVADLAAAPEDKLLKAWEGLGYYSRVRNMQSAAQQVVADYDGEMPDTIEGLSSLKGIGPYTAGAVGSIAFDIPEPAIDGNVMRVFSRLFEVSDDIAKPASRKTFDGLVREVISHEDPSSFNQAIMDLGATICTPTSPKCETCPLKEYCGAYAAGTMTEYPVKSKKVKSRPVYYLGKTVVNEAGEFLIEQRASTGLLANLWTFPLVEVSKEIYEGIKTSYLDYEKQQEAQVVLDLVAEDGLSLAEYLNETEVWEEIVWQKQPVGEITHVFSHLKWHVLIAYGRQKEGKELVLTSNQRWVKGKEFNDYPFPKPQQKMVEVLMKTGYIK